MQHRWARGRRERDVEVVGEPVGQCSGETSARPPTVRCHFAGPGQTSSAIRTPEVHINEPSPTEGNTSSHVRIDPYHIPIRVFLLLVDDC